MSLKNPVVLIIIATCIIFFGGIFVISTTTQNSPQVSASLNAKAYVPDPTSYDWGTIQYSGPKATKTFTIKNSGTDTLKLFNIRTSCHCTNAFLTIGGVESPKFGMSGFSSWVGEVKPGQDAKLTVLFDQSFHGPQGIGPVTRYVEVETNDSRIPRLTFILTGIVVK